MELRDREVPVRTSGGAREAVLDLEFKKGFTLTCHVLVDGQPLAAGMVGAWGMGESASSRTAYDGSFTLRGLPDGPVTLVISSNKGYVGTRAIRVAEDQDVSVALSTGRLAGRVFAATGEPVEDATVTVDAWIPSLQTSASVQGARTGADGAFEIPRLGAGTYKLKVSKEGFSLGEATAEVPPGGTAPLVEVLLTPREGAH